MFLFVPFRGSIPLRKLYGLSIIRVCDFPSNSLKTSMITPQICIKYSIPDAVPPIHPESCHVATEKDPSKFRSIFSDNLQPITIRGKKARGTLLVDIGCSSKCAPLSVSFYNEISGGHIGSCRCSEEGLCGMTNYPIGPHRTPSGPNRTPSDPTGPRRTNPHSTSYFLPPTTGQSFAHSRAPCKHVR